MPRRAPSTNQKARCAVRLLWKRLIQKWSRALWKVRLPSPEKIILIGDRFSRECVYNERVEQKQMTTTERFFSVIPPQTRNEILDNVANHYGISRQEAFEEVTDTEAESLLDYVTGPTRAATSILMQRHGLR